MRRHTHEFINADVSRSGLSRCLRRHEAPSLKELRAREHAVDQPKHQHFKDYEPGFVHVDLKYLPQMPDEDQRKYLFAAIDRATRWVYVEILSDKSARSAKGFLKRLIDKAPFEISKILTDNGKEFTDRFCVTGERKPTGNHPFDQVCASHAIEHRLIRAKRPQTNGMIERFNGRIADVLATTRFDSSESLAQTIIRYVKVYNQHIPQKALGHIAPIQAMKKWRQAHPELFRKRVYNLAELDSYMLLKQQPVGHLEKRVFSAIAASAPYSNPHIRYVYCGSPCGASLHSRKNRCFSRCPTGQQYLAKASRSAYHRLAAR